ncbi:PIR protein CIR protein [Plasmodium vinckei lentum]|uniref:PIR protein CIR protein n=1 Tax=Plasmodium vinckei lentum TaxID=138297 RepID=A0A6V7S7L4_PLAVN|nr:PIR protein CIR protein [Plasmodium vinckei lentum]
MDAKVCDFLYEVNDVFTKEIIDEKKFNKFTKYHSYCPYQNNSNEKKCTNNYERINALGAYLFNKISEIDTTYKNKNGVSQNIELFMIWIGGKLFKMDNDYKATLEESYKKHLGKHMGNFNYWDVINSKSIYKDATIRKMSELDILLNNICKLITEYNKNSQNPDRKRLGNLFTLCLNSYRSFYTSASGCKPYLHLLDSLKMMYEIFRSQKIVNNSLQGREKELLLKRINHLTMFKDENKLFVSVNENLSFSDKECIGVKSKDEKIGEQIASKKSQDLGKSKNPARGNQAQVPGNAQRGNIGSTKRPAPPPAPAKPVAVKPSPQSPPSEKDTKLKTPQAGKTNQNGPGDKVNRAGGGKGDTGSGVNGGGSGPGDHIDKGSQGGSGNQVNTGSQTSHSGDPSHGNQVPAQPAPASSGAGTPQSAGMTKPGTSQSPTVSLPVPSLSPSDPQKPGPQPHQPKPPVPNPSQTNPQPLPPISQNDSSSQKSQTGGSGSGNGNPGGESSNPPSSVSGGSFGLGSSFLEFILKGKEYYNKVSEFIKDNQQNFKDAAEKISGAYNNTVENLKSAYNASSDYFNSVINNITSHFNQVDSPPKPGGIQPGSGNSTTGGNSSNQLSPPQPPSATDSSSPSNPPKNSSQDPVTTPTKDPSPNQPSASPTIDTPSTPAPNPTPTTSIDPIPQKHPPPQPQPITQHHAQVPAQINQLNSQKIVQFVKSLSSNPNLKKTWNLFPTTWNGSGDCKPEIKLMNTTLVCCTSEQCSLTGISVILVLIPIILSIAYKYLSFGLSKKSEKKNMKRVINFHDGKNKTKIIISSYDNKKDLKPVINSVGEKKGSLLNIYKLMQADPIPFINLFFLLIFFVYKRKRDTIE